MGNEVYDEFEVQLHRWQKIYRNSPEKELIRLCLLALEREELVTIAYREEMIVRRLKSMPVNDDVRELIRHAMVWAWKDEEMHAIYIRGLILKLGSRMLRARAYLRQLAGCVGGWAGGVRQHLTWRETPFCHTLATLVTWGGIVTGQVPPEVRRHLQHGPFRDFCAFNVDAEKTAWLCWKRIEELARTLSGFSHETINEFRTVWEDEDKHARVFDLLGQALDDQDCLRSDWTSEKLAANMSEIGEYFLPRSLRTTTISDNPLGSGGNVWVKIGATSRAKLNVFHQLLEDSLLAERLNERAKSLGKSLSNLRVVIKPTFMLGYDRKDMSPITDPDLIMALSRYLKQLGCCDITVVEARNIYDRFYENRTVHDVAKYCDISSDDFRVVDLSDEQIPHSYYRGIGQYTIARTWKEADFRITFGKMKSHSIELVSLCILNLEGIGSRSDQFLFAERQVHRETAIMMMIDSFPPHFALLDGYDSAPDGLVGMMGCPHPKSPMRLYAERMPSPSIWWQQVIWELRMSHDPSRCAQPVIGSASQTIAYASSERTCPWQGGAVRTTTSGPPC